MNDNNLKTPSHREAVDRGKKGGQRSGEVRRERKRIKEYLEILLSVKENEPSILEEMNELDLNEEDKTQAMAITLSALKKAKSGDLRAIEFIRDTIGEKPSLDINSNMDIKSSESKVRVYLPDNGRDKLK